MICRQQNSELGGQYLGKQKSCREHLSPERLLWLGRHAGASSSAAADGGLLKPLGGPLSFFLPADRYRGKLDIHYISWAFSQLLVQN